MVTVTKDGRQADFPAKLLFTTQETAKILTISERTLFKLIQAGRIQPTWLAPRSRRFTREAIEAFIAESSQRRAG